MRPMAVSAPVMSIPPDLAAVLGEARVHPELRRALSVDHAPSAATLTMAALDLASLAALDPDNPKLIAAQRLPARTRGYVHVIGGGGALHLPEAGGPRALSLAYGALDQRCTNSPRLVPGVVRLLPAGRTATFADLSGRGALAVEVAA